MGENDVLLIYKGFQYVGNIFKRALHEVTTRWGLQKRKLYMLVVFPATGMKYKLSISVDEATVLKVREGMRKGLFRNKSHAFEYAINEVLNEDVD
jgi:hypothetical protein